jgi:hypothetical protein
LAVAREGAIHGARLYRYRSAEFFLDWKKMRFFTSYILPPKNKVSPNITSYDLIKTFALVIMVVDHIGGYFFLDNLWWRSLGFSPPIWLFLVGFARSRSMGPHLWIGCAALVLMNFIAGGHIFPLNIIFSILLTRLILDGVADYMLSELPRMIAGLAILTLAVPLTTPFFEYGTICVIIAIWGYMARSRLSGKAYKTETAYSLFALIVYFILSLGEKWTSGQMEMVFISCIVSFILCHFFKLAEYPSLTLKTPAIVTRFLKMCGRWNFELYILHLLFFKLLAAYLGTGGYGFLQFEWLQV